LDVHLVSSAFSDPPHLCGCVVVAPDAALVRLRRVPLMGFQRIASPPTRSSCPVPPVSRLRRLPAVGSAPSARAVLTTSTVFSSSLAAALPSSSRS
jgi:hypothetical protein